MRSRTLQTGLLLMIATRGQALAVALFAIAILAGFALQAVAVALVAAPFVLLSSVLIYAAVTLFRRAPLMTVAAVAVTILAAIVIGLQHGLAGFVHQAIVHPPIATLEFLGGGIYMTVVGALSYRRFDNEGREIRARIAYGATVMSFWLCILCSTLSLLKWNEQLHPTPTHAVHAKTTASVIHE